MIPYMGSLTVGILAQEHKDWVLMQTCGDIDGWVNWADQPPQPDIEVEVSVRGEDQVRNVTPRAETMSWNVKDVWWRLPGGKK